jgi:hypothetical protein
MRSSRSGELETRLVLLVFSQVVTNFPQLALNQPHYVRSIVNSLSNCPLGNGYLLHYKVDDIKPTTNHDGINDMPCNTANVIIVATPWENGDPHYAVDHTRDGPQTRHLSIGVPPPFFIKLTKLINGEGVVSMLIMEVIPVVEMDVLELHEFTAVDRAPKGPRYPLHSITVVGHPHGGIELPDEVFIIVLLQGDNSINAHSLEHLLQSHKLWCLTNVPPRNPFVFGEGFVGIHLFIHGLLEPCMKSWIITIVRPPELIMMTEDSVLLSIPQIKHKLDGRIERTLIITCLIILIIATAIVITTYFHLIPLNVFHKFFSL